VVVDERDKDTVGDCRFGNGCRTGPRQSLTASSIKSQRVIKNDFYVDDLITGGESDEECIQLYQEISDTLKTAGMSLRKWCTSSQTVLNQLPMLPSELNYILPLKEGDTVGTLGVLRGIHLEIVSNLISRTGVHLSE
jgi:hypothetical protein